MYFHFLPHSEGCSLGVTVETDFIFCELHGNIWVYSYECKAYEVIFVTKYMRAWKSEPVYILNVEECLGFVDVGKIGYVLEKVCKALKGRHF
jgi:hypothetical protein